MDISAGMVSQTFSDLGGSSLPGTSRVAAVFLLREYAGGGGPSTREQFVEVGRSVRRGERPSPWTWPEAAEATSVPTWPRPA